MNYYHTFETIMMIKRREMNKTCIYLFICLCMYACMSLYLKGFIKQVFPTKIILYKYL